MEMNLIGEEDIKVETEELRDTNVDQATCSGTQWIIICLSPVSYVLKIILLVF